MGTRSEEPPDQTLHSVPWTWKRKVGWWCIKNAVLLNRQGRPSRREYQQTRWKWQWEWQ